MMPLGANDDQWIAAIASYVRNSFGNRAPFISAADVARVRAATAARKTMWTPEELEATVPRAHGGAADLEGDREPQRAGGGRRADVHDLEHRQRRSCPGCGSRSNCRTRCV